MNKNGSSASKHRNRNYHDTHLLLIEKAGELISDSGADGVSLSVLSRITGINRSTIYYHFDTREQLMCAAQKWLRERLTEDGNSIASVWAGIDQISAYFKCNPEVIATWTDEYIAAAEVRQRYPQWDRLVAQIEAIFAELASDEPCDAEAYWALMLTSAFNVPRGSTNLVHP